MQVREVLGMNGLPGSAGNVFRIILFWGHQLSLELKLCDISSNLKTPGFLERVQPLIREVTCLQGGQQLQPMHNVLTKIRQRDLY